MDTILTYVYSILHVQDIHIYTKHVLVIDPQSISFAESQKGYDGNKSKVKKHGGTTNITDTLQ